MCGNNGKGWGGVGIPPEKIPNLFQPFRKPDHTRDMAKGGSPGLFSAKKIIDGHGGTITIASEPGHGTTVTVELPLRRSGKRGIDSGLE